MLFQVDCPVSRTCICQRSTGGGTCCMHARANSPQGLSGPGSWLVWVCSGCPACGRHLLMQQQQQPRCGGASLAGRHSQAPGASACALQLPCVQSIPTYARGPNQLVAGTPCWTECHNPCSE
jgi:hypothetical protein